jgi:hypothetical protein
MADQSLDHALGRANAAVAAMFAVLNYLGPDDRLKIFLVEHAERAKARLLQTTTSEAALSEFDDAIASFVSLTSQTQDP